MSVWIFACIPARFIVVVVFYLELREQFASLETNSLFLTSVANIYFPILRVVFFFPLGLPL